MEREKVIEILESAYFGPSPDEEEVLSQLPRLLQGVRHFVDIGASLGQFTERANRILDGGRIDALEADPIRVERLRENCAKWSGKNEIRVHHAAVTDRVGVISFQTTQSNVSGGLFAHDVAHLDEANRRNVQWASVEVPATTLDTLYPDPPDFIKMDIEGAEHLALAGARHILEQRRTRWLIELHDFEGGAKPRDILTLMAERGYHAEEIAEGRVLFRPLTLGERASRRLRSIARSLRG